ncbi:uncharacterized protein LOC123222455 [Mangifera indica]|uniref:uncharacterized protein LOC123222455 n=1 Tax=Mangifera indica TaxID=29780 RepID=UPI001CFA2574|nr:uncharacterized protein LOC123222455 [Mangifera indica]
MGRQLSSFLSRVCMTVLGRPHHVGHMCGYEGVSVGPSVTSPLPLEGIGRETLSIESSPCTPSPTVEDERLWLLTHISSSSKKSIEEEQIVGLTTIEDSLAKPFSAYIDKMVRTDSTICLMLNKRFSVWKNCLTLSFFYNFNLIIISH